MAKGSATKSGKKGKAAGVKKPGPKAKGKAAASKKAKPALTAPQQASAMGLIAAEFEAVGVSPGKTIAVSARSVAATTLVRVTSQHGAVGIWAEGEVDPGPKMAAVPPGQVWALDFFSHFTTAGSIVYRIVESQPGAPPAVFTETRQGAAGETTVFRHIVFG